MPRTQTSDIAARVVGDELRRARKDAGLTQGQLADRLGLSPPYISNVESGRVNLTLGQLARFADALGADLQVRLPRIEIPVAEIELPPTASRA
jgi:putative transcriptional regulator